MILFHVNQQFHARQFRKSRAIRSFRSPSFISVTSSTFPAFLDLPSSVPSSMFRTLQPLSLPLLRKLPWRVPTIPTLELPALPRSLDIQTFRRFSVFRTYPLSFHILAHSLARPKTQPFSFQSVPHSLPKNTGGWGTSRSFKVAKTHRTQGRMMLWP